MTTHSRDQAPGLDAIHVALPMDRFYWAVLDTRTLPKQHRRNARSLGFLLENVLPAPVESIHAAYHWSESETQRVIACAIAKDDLRDEINAHGGVLSLFPDALPSFAAAASGKVIDPCSLNLLTGEFEPSPLRRSRCRMLLQAIGVILVALALVLLGFERRTSVLREAAAEIRSAQAQVVADTLGNTAPPSGQPPELRFLSELRSLRQTRSHQASFGSGSLQNIADVTPSLADLLARWPADLHTLTESIFITPTSMTLRAIVPVTSDAQALADALSKVEDWSLQQPQINAAPPQGVNATLQWKREDQHRDKQKESAS
jgi:type II secretory pathway component PulL